MADPIRVLIADDHPLFRDGMHGLLDSVADTQVVGEARSGEEVVSRTVELQPDVILMDIKMPGMNGIEATREILEASPHIAILVVTMFEDDDFVFAAMRAGARGYLLKGANQVETLRAIRAVANGEAIFWPGGCSAPADLLCHDPDGTAEGLPAADRAGGGDLAAHRPRPDQ